MSTAQKKDVRNPVSAFVNHTFFPALHPWRIFFFFFTEVQYYRQSQPISSSIFRFLAHGEEEV